MTFLTSDEIKGVLAENNSQIVKNLLATGVDSVLAYLAISGYQFKSELLNTIFTNYQDPIAIVSLILVISHLATAYVYLDDNSSVRNHVSYLYRRK